MIVAVMSRAFRPRASPSSILAPTLVETPQNASRSPPCTTRGAFVVLEICPNDAARHADRRRGEQRMVAHVERVRAELQIRIDSFNRNSFVADTFTLLVLSTRRLLK